MGRQSGGAAAAGWRPSSKRRPPSLAAAALALIAAPLIARLIGAARAQVVRAELELDLGAGPEVAAMATANQSIPNNGGQKPGMAELNPDASDTVPLYMQHMTIVLVTLHVSVFLTGLVGNSLVCLSVYRNKSLQTITNYYIVNLAVADFLVILICLPPTVYWDLTLTWSFGPVLCKLVLYLQSISVSVSVLTLTCISVDRWYAICKPLKFCSTKSRAKMTIALIWLVSSLIASPDVIFLTTRPLYEEEGYVYMDCTYAWPERNTKWYQLCIVVLLFLLPFVLMTISYAQIVNVLWRNETMAESMQNSMSRNESLAAAAAAAATASALAATSKSEEATATAAAAPSRAARPMRRGQPQSIMSTTSTSVVHPTSCAATSAGATSNSNHNNNNNNNANNNNNSNNTISADYAAHLELTDEDEEAAAEEAEEDGESCELRQRQTTSKLSLAGWARACLGACGRRRWLARAGCQAPADAAIQVARANGGAGAKATASEQHGRRLPKRWRNVISVHYFCQPLKNGCHLGGPAGKAPAQTQGAGDKLEVVSNYHEHGVTGADETKGLSGATATGAPNGVIRLGSAPAAARQRAGAGNALQRAANGTLEARRKIRWKVSSERLFHVGGEEAPLGDRANLKAPADTLDELLAGGRHLQRPRKKVAAFEGCDGPNGFGGEAARMGGAPNQVAGLRAAAGAEQRRLACAVGAQLAPPPIGQRRPEGAETPPPPLTIAAGGAPSCQRALCRQLQRARCRCCRRHRHEQEQEHEHEPRRRHCHEPGQCEHAAGHCHRPRSSARAALQVTSQPPGDAQTFDANGLAICTAGRKCRPQGVVVVAGQRHLKCDNRQAIDIDQQRAWTNDKAARSSIGLRRGGERAWLVRGAREMHASPPPPPPPPLVGAPQKARGILMFCPSELSGPPGGAPLTGGLGLHTNGRGEGPIKAPNGRLASGAVALNAPDAAGANCCKCQAASSAEKAEANRASMSPGRLATFKVLRAAQSASTLWLDGSGGGAESKQTLDEPAAGKPQAGGQPRLMRKRATPLDCALTCRNWRRHSDAAAGLPADNFLPLLNNNEAPPQVNNARRQPDERKARARTRNSCAATAAAAAAAGSPSKSGSASADSASGAAAVEQLHCRRRPTAGRHAHAGHAHAHAHHHHQHHHHHKRRRAACHCRCDLAPAPALTAVGEPRAELSGELADCTTPKPSNGGVASGAARQIAPRASCSSLTSNPAAAEAEGRRREKLAAARRAARPQGSATGQPQQQQQQLGSSSASANMNMRFYKLIESRKKAAKMLIVIVIMFGLCYLPVHFLNTLRVTIGLPQNDITTIASLVSHWLCYFNSAVNPLIYNLMSGKFRHEFANLFFCRWLRRRGAQTQQLQQQQQHANAMG